MRATRPIYLLLPAWMATLLGTSLTVFPFLGLLSLLLLPLVLTAWLLPATRLPRAAGAIRFLAVFLFLAAPAVMTLPTLRMVPHVNYALVAESRARTEKATAEWSAVRTELPLCAVAGTAAAGLELLGLRWWTGHLAMQTLLIVPLFAGFGPAVVFMVRMLSTVWPLTA